MAKSKGKKTEKEIKKKSKRTTFLIILISILCIIFLRTGFIFVVIALLPTIVAYYLDTTSSRAKFHTVFACNLSGLLPRIAEMLKEGNQSSSYTTEMMSNSMHWLTIYASAGFGWLLVFATPLFAQFIISAFNQGKISHFQSVQDRIIKEWGPEVATAFPTTNDDDD